MTQRSDNGDGKLIDTWWYEYKGIVEKPAEGDEPPIQSVEPKKVAVQLRIIKKFENSDQPPLATREVVFKVVCKEIELSLDGSDIEALRVATWDALDKKYAIKWERYYLVQVRPESPYEGMGDGLVFSYQHIERGSAWDGTLLLRKHDRYRDVIEPWPGEFRDKRNKVIACIPDTDFNRHALEEFGNGIDNLRRKMAEYLRPDRIMKTLASLQGCGLLPAGTGKEPDTDE